MQRLRLFSRPLVVLFTLLSLILCPITSGKLIPSNNVLAGDLRQIDFTPHIFPLALTQTVESIGIDPNLRTTPIPHPTFGPGQYFEDDDPYSPQFDDDLIVGNKKYGYARFEENPDLYAVWITNEDGTHYLIVEKDSEVLTGGTDPNSGFFTLIMRIEEKYEQIQTAVDQRDAHYTTEKNYRWGEVVTTVIWSACVIFTEGLCLPLVGVFGGLFGLSMNKENDAKIQETIIDGHQREVANIQSKLRGKFKIGQVIYDQP